MTIKATLELRLTVEAEGRVIREMDGPRIFTAVEDLVVYAVGRNGQRVELPYDWFVAGDLRAVRDALIDAEFEARS